MSKAFAGLTIQSAPAAAQPTLARARAIFGFVPNLAVTMAAVPAALETYFQSLQAFADTPLSPIEQQVVLMAASRVNGADYSLAIHAAFAAKLGTDPTIVRAVATGGIVEDQRLSALRRFAETLTLSRGRVTDEDVETFLAAGFDPEAMVAVAFGMAIKTFANSLAVLAHTPVDAAFTSTLEGLGSEAS
jgi:AhpD family alkylhydroperoxidase